MTAYLTDRGKIVRVEQSFDHRWGTFSRRPWTESLERFKSPNLPMRDSLLDAIRDLDTYANARGWTPVVDDERRRLIGEEG